MAKVCCCTEQSDLQWLSEEIRSVEYTNRRCFLPSFVNLYRELKPQYDGTSMNAKKIANECYMSEICGKKFPCAHN